MDELQIEYRGVLNFPGYRVGSDGSVWSCLKNSRSSAEIDGWHLLVGSFDKDGYRRVILCRNGKRKYCRVNVLVLETFVGGPPVDMNNPTAAHKNGIRDDNRLSNLQWKSQKSNIADKAWHGTAQVGEMHPKSILTEAAVREIRRRRASGEIYRTIANDFGVKLVTVQAVCARRLWSHVE